MRGQWIAVVCPFATSLLLQTGLARASDGVIEINQARAAVGKVTAGDLPGFPVEINEAGSYVLTGTLDLSSPPVAEHGILINASDVTLDLNGFRLVGTAQAVKNGIETANVQNLTIENGFITGWGGDGIHAQDADRTRVSSVTASDNGQDGIQVGENSLVVDSVSNGNGYDGIDLSFGGVVRSSTVSNNGRDGVDGERTLVIGVNARENGFDGISVNLGSVLDSTATDNTGDGIQANVATVRNCLSQDNGGAGIRASNGSVVSHSSAYSNDSDGITAGSGTFVTDNTSIANAGAGIHLLFTTFIRGNRVDGNNVHLNAIGIDVDQQGNSIVRNVAGGNTTADYDIIVGNFVGTIQTTMPAVGGPWDNFSQ